MRRRLSWWRLRLPWWLFRVTRPGPALRMDWWYFHGWSRRAPRRVVSRPVPVPPPRVDERELDGGVVPLVEV